MDLESKLARALGDANERGELMSGFVSKHINPDHQYNENNVGIGYLGPGGWMGGAYKNSLNKTSVYAGREALRDLFGDRNNGLRGGVVVGAVTGYGKPLTPMVLPELVYRMGDQSIAGTFVPPVRGMTPATVALQLRRKF
jgi:hypothetical protein